MKIIRTLCFLLVAVLASLGLSAQATDHSAIGETMRSSGRIYVVVAVMLTILAGLIIYLLRLDRRISRIEKE